MMAGRVDLYNYMLETPSNRDRKLQSITELNNNITKDKTVKILLIIESLLEYLLMLCVLIYTC